MKRSGPVGVPELVVIATRTATRTAVDRSIERLKGPALVIFTSIGFGLAVSYHMQHSKAKRLANIEEKLDELITREEAWRHVDRT